MGTKVLAAIAAFALSVGAVQATTIDFSGVGNGANVDLGDGFLADDLRRVGGNCNVKPCMALNTNEMTTITNVIGDGKFTLTSIWVQLVGEPSVLTLLGSNNHIETIVIDNNNKGTDISLAGLFDDVTFIKFSNTGTANVRVDDIVATGPSPIPLPASGWMFLAGFGGLAAAKRRKKA